MSKGRRAPDELQLKNAVPAAIPHPPALAPTEAVPKPAHFLVSRSWDFWLLGGFSVALGLAMFLGQLFRDQSKLIEMHFLQVPAIFGLLALLCNDPHFIVSYRIGYGRGLKFIGRHWFCLIAVPLALLALFGSAYYFAESQAPMNAGTLALNRAFTWIGTDFQFGSHDSFGAELMAISIWLMYLTVGWHYAKQVFGCMIVYAQYDGYPLGRRQRQILKANLLGVALFYFVFVNASRAASAGGSSLDRLGFPAITLAFPQATVWACGALLVALVLAALGIFAWNHNQHGRLPGATFLVTWLAFHVWWIPLLSQPEYYLFAVPFFHSLQYLPFAYRIENAKVPISRWLYASITWRVALLLLIGFLAFELVPYQLDQTLDTSFKGIGNYFVASFLVFLNVHHFFIDSVSWKRKNGEIRENLLARA